MTMTGPKDAAPSATAAPLARRPSSDADLFKMALEPEGIAAAMSLCETIAKTGMFSGDKGGSPAPAGTLLVRLMTGRALGIPAMVALNNVYDVYGRPAISSRLKVALCRRDPECERFELKESNDKFAVYVVRRAGMAEREFRFDISEAERAKLVKPDSNWAKWPKRMLEARAASYAADVMFPEATMGLPTEEEARDEDRLRPGEVRGEVVPPTVPARAWTDEAAAIKEEIQKAVLNKDAGAMKEARKALKDFVKEAPAEVGEDLTRFYNLVRDKETKGDSALTPPHLATNPESPDAEMHRENRAKESKAANDPAPTPAASLPKLDPDVCVVCKGVKGPLNWERDAVPTTLPDGRKGGRHQGCVPDPFGVQEG